MKWMKIAILACMPLALTSCFLSPGAFTSNLDLRRDGSFSFAYNGEIVITAPDDMMPGSGFPDENWNDSMAYCYDTIAATDYAGDAAASGAAAAAEQAAAVPTAVSDSQTRDCTKKELAEQKKDHEESQKMRVENKKRESDQFAAMFGFAPGDDAANRKVAARLMKQPGWKNATYVGAGVFQIDYAYTGKIGHDFIFPLFENSDVIFPFVTMRPRADGSVMVSGPGLMGGITKTMGLRAGTLGATSLIGGSFGGAKADAEKMGNPRTKGTFTITTDGAIATNNTEDGPAAAYMGQTLMWDIDSKTNKIPEALIRLK